MRSFPHKLTRVPAGPARRPRERVNRPQTRRRRENTQDCLDKLRQIRESMLKALELTELLVFREARKRDIHVSGRARGKARGGLTGLACPSSKKIRQHCDACGCFRTLQTYAAGPSTVFA